MILDLLLPTVLAVVPSSVTVLHEWDHQRAEAWARGDAAGLHRLYTPRSAAGRTDVAMLRAWQEHGLRVRGLEVQLIAVRELARTPTRLVLDVTDRVAGGIAVPGGFALPRDHASDHTVVLRVVAGEWRVATVRPGPPG